MGTLLYSVLVDESGSLAGVLGFAFGTLALPALITLVIAGINSVRRQPIAPAGIVATFGVVWVVFLFLNLIGQMS